MIVALDDFWCYTKDADIFGDDLEALCQEFGVPGEDAFYFEIEADEDDEENIYVEILDFEIETDKKSEFVAKLEKMCKKHGGKDGYEWVVTEIEDE